jgi:hypothetical protein
VTSGSTSASEPVRFTHMNPWSKRPGKKVSVPRFSLESWAQHMADPAQYANMLREHTRSIREQLKLLDKREE